MNWNSLFTQYLNDLSEASLRGDAREESFYPALASALSAFAGATGRGHIHVTTLPKPTEGGNPDFRLWNGKDRIVGYIEAKKPTEERLDAVESSEQLRRYLDIFPNLILTNFFEFRLYRHGERVETVLAARPFTLTQLKTKPTIDKPDELAALLNRFMDFSLPKAFTAESLAVELAKRTRFLCDVVAMLLEEERDAPSALTGFYDAFQQYLIGDLSIRDFADLYAQTVAYGLFAARTRATGEFNRRAAFDAIPHTIGVLRDLFRFISLGDPPEQMAWSVDDLSEVLAVADAPGILERYYREGKGDDPIIHFYETFLAQYDPAERERRGVYYTPEPVVSYIVHSLHELLQSEFDKPDGLASPDVTLLDPAAGTMTFIARAAQIAVTEFEGKYGAGAREDFIRQHILKNFYAFELMMAPYAVGHLKMSFFLEELGHRLADDERMPFYLTNTLDVTELEQSRLPGFFALSEESHRANQIKQQTPVLVILGNPPYSGHSSNTGDWIRGLIDDYKRVDGKPLGEKNPKWLQDDYVKFLRFAQWKIDQAGRGVVGVITNHSYLDNPTFRGMRQSLMQTFDEIYILDLHGNSLKKETAPDGSLDQNVFDIRQGVAIALFVKRGGPRKKDAVARHAELWGARRDKYEWLHKHNRKRTKWTKLKPNSPAYLFIPRDNKLEAQYRRYSSIPNIFPVNSVGIVTARDKLTIHWSEADLWKTVNLFAKMDSETARLGYQLGKDVRDWKVTFAQQDLLDSGPKRENIYRILYRPFDVRYTYYTGRSRGFHCMPRPKVMHHMLAGENLALIVPKQHKDDFGALATNIIGAHKSVAAFDINYLFPLYLYPTDDGNGRFEGHERIPNIASEVTASLTNAYNRKPAPEEIFHYIYAILYAPAYRERFADFLRMDFPRIPFTADKARFKNVAALGARLTALHLLNSPELDPPACRFEGQGDGRVAKGGKAGVHYQASERRVYINATQYFAPVPEEIWNYQVGGYTVCAKWLKDRQERRLELDDIRVYCRIVTAIKITLDVQRKIDIQYAGVESGELILDIHE